MSMDLTVRVVHRDAETASAVVAVSGELDACNQGQVESALELLIAEGVLHVLVDAAMMTFCDISGMRMLARAHRDLRDRGGELVVIAHEAVHKLGQLMWPGPSPSRPALFLARDQRPAVPKRMRHTSVLRGVGRRSRSRGERNAAGASSAPRPAREPNSPVDRRSVLEKSEKLRKEMAAERERMLAQAETICVTLAAVHEQLASLHVIIETCRGALSLARPAGAPVPESPVVPVRDPLTCDGHSHLAAADKLRDRVSLFEGYAL
ncbi:STAS domain-containing protein [Planobispora longispora]|uniref:STAS domain-containing protein n=1 Tax=Planobispora longispora TaxID=28887 RepID=A0A8J3W261_9ACTN|nr:STAS domain-containing protein [Planobispora longispora]GIH73999.1 hypothetical protein Plo01_04280 [Planobispora longispora]